MLTQILDRPPYSLEQEEKDRLLLDGLNQLTEHHYKACVPYRAIIDGIWSGETRAEKMVAIPYLPVTLFKNRRLASVPDDDIVITLTSSGTTGQAVSQIAVDKETSTRQQKALAQSMAHILGKTRLPMLVVDSSAVFKNPAMMSARGAGVMGMMRFGYRPVFALDEHMEPDMATVQAFLDRVDGKPFFIFGFTFMVWKQLYERFREDGLDMSNGILVHSGGWKKMAEYAVDNETFKKRLTEAFGLQKIHNFYGMVEQIGSIFLEGEDGLLYPPNFSEVIIRNPITWEPCTVGEEGLIQILSLIPKSYPGHSLLTEDIGVIERISNNGRFVGKGIRVLGRLKKAEIRGCSDVIASAA